MKNPTRKDLKEKLSEYYPKDGVAGFYMDEKYGLQFYPESGIIYPIFNTKGQIVCLRIGVDFPTISSDRGDFKWNPYLGEWQNRQDEESDFETIYSETKGIYEITLDENKLPKVENRKISNKYKYVYSGNKETGASYGSQVGFYIPIMKNDEILDYSVCFGTEGEKKCIVGSNMLKTPFVDITGVSNFKRAFKFEDGTEESVIDFLVKKGCKIFVVAYDADKSVNLNVLQAERSFLANLISKGITPAVAEWDAHWGKGLDDALMAGITPVYYMINV